jgi:hypothetical protein
MRFTAGTRLPWVGDSYLESTVPFIPSKIRDITP